jgi:hypothetical protein
MAKDDGFINPRAPGYLASSGSIETPPRKQSHSRLQNLLASISGGMADGSYGTGHM